MCFIKKNYFQISHHILFFSNSNPFVSWSKNQTLQINHKKIPLKFGTNGHADSPIKHCPNFSSYMYSLAFETDKDM